MNAAGLAKHYGGLTPEERFRLILAAGARGDDTERERLVSAGGRLTLSMQDHAPYAHAFDELGLLVFIELLEEAGRYSDAFADADDARDICGEDDDGEGEGDAPEAEPDTKGNAADAEDDARPRPAWQRSLDLALAAGFVLRTKAEGWKLFCERLNVPPFVLWERLPGFDRLQRALTLAERAAFVPEGFLRWLNRIRPAGAAELTEVPLSVEGMASTTETLFRNRVEWWSG
jgi:hypothetical protein